MNENRFLRFYCPVTWCLLVLLSFGCTYTHQLYGQSEPENTDEGYIDFVEKLNETRSANVSHEKNAATDLLHLIGPAGGSEKQWTWCWSALKSDNAIPQGPFFKPFGEIEESIDLDTVNKLTRTFWKNDDYPAVARWIQENTIPLGTLVQSLEKEQYFMPIGNGDANQSMMSCEMPTLMRIREVSKLVAIRAMNHFAREEYEEGLDNVHRIHQLGRVVGSGGFLIEMMIGVDICDRASRAEWELIVSGSVPKEVLLAYLQKKRQLGPLPEVSNCIASEQLMNLDCVQLLKKGEWEGLEIVPQKSSFDMEFAFDEVNKVYDSISDAMTKNQDDFSETIRSIKVVEKNQRKIVDLGAGERLSQLSESEESRSRFLGRVMIANAFPAFSQIYTGETRCKTWTQLSEMAFRLEIHKLDTGSYPKQLNEVALEEERQFLLIDSFSSNQAFQYQRTDDGYKLYSVSMNGMDNGGKGLVSQPEQKLGTGVFDLGFEKR